LISEYNLGRKLNFGLDEYRKVRECADLDFTTVQWLAVVRTEEYYGTSNSGLISGG
jgi:hypothetical protein